MIERLDAMMVSEGAPPMLVQQRVTIPTCACAVFVGARLDQMVEMEKFAAFTRGEIGDEEAYRAYKEVLSTMYHPCAMHSDDGTADALMAEMVRKANAENDPDDDRLLVEVIEEQMMLHLVDGPVQ